jgi:hypothetical protein
MCSKRAPIPCGYPVNNHGIHAREAVQFSVDRKALIVRNPHEGVRKGAIVDDWGITVRSCSRGYFLLQQHIGRSMHIPPVPTGTTINLEFSRR